MKLYEIANEYQNILEQSFNEETGEVNENALSKLDEISVQLHEKGIAVASYIKNIDAERKAIEEAKKAMAEREGKLNKEIDYLTQYLQNNMEKCGISEIKSPYFVIKLKKCPYSTDIIDESLIPDEYRKVKAVVSIDKVKLKEEMLAGVVVPGVALKQNNRIEIR